MNLFSLRRSGVRVSARVHRPLGKNGFYPAVREEIKNRMQSIGMMHIEKRSAIVQNWKQRPSWVCHTIVSSDGVVTTVKFRQPSSKPVKIWNIVDETGAKSHTIEAKHTKALRFTVGGKVVFARRVSHPGMKPKHYSAQINAELEPLFKKEVYTGYMVGMAKSYINSTTIDIRI